MIESYQDIWVVIVEGKIPSKLHQVAPIDSNMLHSLPPEVASEGRLDHDDASDIVGVSEDITDLVVSLGVDIIAVDVGFAAARKSLSHLLLFRLLSY
jgi:hypothetical protein